MPRHRLGIILVFIVLVLPIIGTTSAVQGATNEQINKAIKSGKEYLYGAQAADGTWEGTLGQKGTRKFEGGATSMVLYALLSTGESEKDPRLTKAIAYLLKADLTYTYSLSFQALALSKLSPSPAVQAKILKVGKKLVSGIERKEVPGLYGYSIPMEATHFGNTYYDHSNSQYGVLGVWACVDAGMELPGRYWEVVDKAWRDSQNKDGGWGYWPDEDPDSGVTMSSAGIATLFITDDELSFKKTIDCKGNSADPAIDNAMKWITPHMPKAWRDDGRDLYQWYGIERIAIASGFKYFGDFEWFKEGADLVVTHQAGNGSWNDAGLIPGTCYGTLFLYRGKGAIVMNKLKYDKDGTATPPVEGTWNQRNRDAAGAAKFIGEQLESFMNWQVVTMDVDPDEIHDAPILYLAGFDKLKFSPEQEAKLKKFVEDGGMLLGNADCASPNFSTSFKDLCKKLFDGKYEFRRLPETSPIYTHQQFVASKWRVKPLESMSNGVREMAVLISKDDASKAWHSNQFKNKRESFELIADLYLYSVDRQSIAEKGVTYVVKPNADAVTGDVKVARLQYTGNWDPEPGGWRRLSAVLHNDDKIGATVETVKLGGGQLAGHNIAHLTGTAAFELDDASRDEIKKFVAGGGTLVVDSAGGSNEFADAAEKELGKIFGDDAKQLTSPLPLPSPLFAGIAMADVKFRSIVRTVKPDIKGCQIRGIQFNGRVGVFFSREDLSAGLVGESVDGVVGYTPESATRLMSAIVQDAIKPPAH